MLQPVETRARVLASLADVPREAWQPMFGAAALGYDYYRACEKAHPEAFAFSAAGAFRGDRLIAGMPLFEVVFRLEMALEGAARRIVQGISRVWSRLVNIPILGAGSPHAEQLALVFAPELDEAARREALSALLGAMETEAARKRIDLLVLKDVRDRDTRWAHDLLAKAGFARTQTLPVAMLDLPYASEEAYIQSLSANQRSNLRRKLKGAAKVRVEIRDRIDDVADDMTRLFNETRLQAKANYDVFEQLAPGYFRQILEEMGDRARIILYWLDDKLIAFSLVLISPETLVFQYIGMSYPVARDCNIYFLNWMVLVRMCIERGIPRLHAGQSTYVTKVRLGCRLEREWIYFRHRTAFWNRIFHLAGPRIRFDTLDPDLKELGASAPYLD